MAAAAVTTPNGGLTCHLAQTAHIYYMSDTTTYAQLNADILEAMTGNAVYTSADAERVLARFERLAEQGGREDQLAGERAALGGPTLAEYAAQMQARAETAEARLAATADGVMGPLRDALDPSDDVAVVVAADLSRALDELAALRTAHVSDAEETLRAVTKRVSFEAARTTDYEDGWTRGFIEANRTLLRLIEESDRD